MTIRTRTPRTRTAGTLLAVVLLAVVAAGCLPAEEQSFLDRTNALRSSVGVRPLQEHGTLTAKAEAWANYMARTGRLEHSNLAADLPGVQWMALGENVGYSSRTSDTPLTIHNAFVASPGHKRNLVDSRFTHMGIGVATDGAGRVWVAEVFAKL